MAYLVLDLDLTVFASERDAPSVGFWSSEDLSSGWIDAKLDDGGYGNFETPVKLIHPDKLSELIEYACKEHDGIIINTAGCWNAASIKDILIHHLDVSVDTENKIKNCFFLNTQVFKPYFPAHSVMEVASHFSKKQRLDLLKSKRKEFDNKHFVFVDDRVDELEKFIDDEMVLTVHATTDKDDIKYFYSEKINQSHFYQEARMALAYSKEQENLALKNADSSLSPESSPRKSLQRPLVLVDNQNLQAIAKKQKITHSKLFANEILPDVIEAANAIMVPKNGL